MSRPGAIELASEQHYVSMFFRPAIAMGSRPFCRLSSRIMFPVSVSTRSLVSRSGVTCHASPSWTVSRGIWSSWENDWRNGSQTKRRADGRPRNAPELLGNYAEAASGELIAEVGRAGEVPRLELHLNDAFGFADGGADFEADFLAHRLHVLVLAQGVGDEASHLLVLGDLDQALGQLGAQPLALPRVGDHDGKFAGVVRVQLAEAGHADDLSFPVAVLVLGDERDLAVVVIETDTHEASVGDALLKLERAEVTQIDAPLGEAFVELDHDRLVLGPDRADGHLLAVFHLPGADVLGRIGANGQLGQLVLGGLRIVQDDAGVESDQVIAGGKERVDVDLLDPDRKSTRL